MILIADSGSTKTHWCIADEVSVFKQVFTSGINPYYQTDDEIQTIIQNQLLQEITDYSIDAIFYYGAGCAFPEKKAMINRSFVDSFKNTNIVVESDLLGAARALFHGQQGIACILGTGSNSCLYDGEHILQNVSPLGFILGDEGSGAALGKRFVGDCLKNQLPTELKDKFLNQFDLTPELILDRVYKKPFPNRFLASLSVFLLENINQSQIYDIVYNEFDSFIKRNITQYPYLENKVGFVGSIAYYFADILHEVAQKNGISISEIIRQPMDGLIPYHTFRI